MPKEEIDLFAAMNPAPVGAPEGEIVDAEFFVEPDGNLPAVITLDPVPFRARLSRHKQELALMVARAQAHAVTDEASNLVATDIATDAKRLLKEIEGYEKEIAAPHTAYLHEVHKEAKIYKEPLQVIVTGMGRKMGDYRQILENERAIAEAQARKAIQEAQAKMEAKAKEDAKDGVVYQPVQFVAPIMPEVPRVTRTSGGSASQAKRWDFEVVDENLLSREFLSTDEKKIRAWVRGGGRNSPGLIVREVYDTKYRL